MQLGHQKVQGVDYAYTLQGWLKGVNSALLTPGSDMGDDGLTGGTRAVGRVNSGYFFTIADKLWKQVMHNVANEINRLGGQVTFDEAGVISKRINFSSVESSDKDAIKK